MEAKSRLPKPAGLRPPHVVTKPTFDKVPTTASAVKPPTNYLRPPQTQFLRRRSKSVTDLRSLAGRPLPKVSELKKIVENIKPKKPLVPTQTTNSASQRNPVKRPASKTDDDVKPKVARQRIPDWDYKSRFNLLTEKYKTITDENMTLKNKLSEFGEIDARFTQLQSEKAAADEQISQLSKDKEQFIKLQKEHLQLSNDFENTVKERNDLNSLCEELTTKKRENESELEKLRIIEIKYRDLCTEHEKIVHNFNSLTKDHQSLCERTSTLTEQLTTKIHECSTLQKENAALEEALLKQEILRRSLHNTIQDLKGTIRVFCRVRPPVFGESEYIQCSLNFIDDNGLEIRRAKELASHNSRNAETKAEFSFDHVFPPTSTQQEIFEELSLLVQSALDGYNVCIFAYGQTGSGKTYTMQGQDTPEELGLIPRAIDLIFQSIEELKKSNWTYDVSASFLEIYNENIQDLIIPNSQNLDICFNEGKGTTVNNLTTKRVESAEELKDLMREALGNRKVAATNFNERSSRSHAVSKIYLEGTNLVGNISCSACINLVDLAGSESAKFSIDQRLNETKYINKSLSALGNVMMALHNKRKHIPYRDSKLTYLLQSSLGGNSKTLMIVNISPFEQNYGESVNTLRFASKVKEVSNAGKRNRVLLSPNSSRANNSSTC